MPKISIQEASILLGLILLIDFLYAIALVDAWVWEPQCERSSSYRVRKMVALQLIWAVPPVDKQRAC